MENKLIEKFYNTSLIENIRNSKFIKENPRIAALIKFSAIGGLNNIIDFAIYIFLTRGFSYWQQHYLLANLVAYLISILATFDLMRVWVFKLPILPDNEQEARELKISKEEEKNIHIEYFKFLLVGLGALLLNEIGLLIFVDFLKIHDILSKLCVAFIVWLLRFNTHQGWTFKKNKS